MNQASGWWMALLMPAMMLPTTLPFLVAYARRRRDAPRALGVAVLVAIYALVWAALGAAAWPIAAMVPAPGLAVSAVVVAAGLAYGLTPIQRTCRERCQTLGGKHGSAVRLGLDYSVNCLGCSAGVMAALFVVGPMNPLWMLLATGAVAAFKLPARRVAIP